MNYHEEYMDLFDTSSDYVLVHCISVDCKMGAGIARQFTKKFPDLKSFCRSQNPHVGKVILYQGKRDIFNLVTKEKYFEKPTYLTMSVCIDLLQHRVCENKYNKIAMPLIGAGLDRLKWPEVRKIIKQKFKSTDIEILVCIK